MTPSRTATAAAPAARIGRIIVLALIAGLLLSVNAWLVGRSLGAILEGAPAVDWTQYVEASRRVFSGGDLYDVTPSYAYHYSPLLAAAFAGLAPLGVIGWGLLHLAAALAMPSWSMRLAALASWPFWYDVEAGNVLVFVVLAAAWALRGNRLATAAYLLLVVLIPRPLVIPVAAWLLWRHSETRIPFVVLFSIHAIAVVALGWAGPWLAAMLAAAEDVRNPSNIGPSALIGTLPWLIIGLPAAAWLTWRGRVGMASLAASPYWLPYYLLVVLLDGRWLAGAVTRLIGARDRTA